MDRIDAQLSTDILDPKYRPSVRVAVALGKKTLNKYYDWTDHSELYRISMSTSFYSTGTPGPSLMLALPIVLHPGHKLEYFRDNDWDEEWIDAAKEITRKEYERKYAGHVKPDGPRTASGAASTSAQVRPLLVHAWYTKLIPTR